jgi:hypothetical protein
MIFNSQENRFFIRNIKFGEHLNGLDRYFEFKNYDVKYDMVRQL